MLYMYSSRQEVRGCSHYFQSYPCRFIFPTLIYTAAWISFIKSLMGFLEVLEPTTYDKALVSLASLVLIASTFLYIIWMLYLYRIHYNRVKEGIPYDSENFNIRTNENIKFMRGLPNLSLPESLYFQKYTNDSLPEIPRGFDHPNASSTPRDQSSDLSRVPITTLLDPIVEEDIDDQSIDFDDTDPIECKCDGSQSLQASFEPNSDQNQQFPGPSYEVEVPEPSSDVNYVSAFDTTPSQLESISLETPKSSRVPPRSRLYSTNFMNV